MQQSLKLPLGILNNNPGNLREAVGPEFPTEIRHGLANFASMMDGVSAYFYLIDVYRTKFGCTTLTSIVTRYAPVDSDNVLLYITDVAARLRIPAGKAHIQELGLETAWRAVDLARAMFQQENGPPPSGWRAYPEWVSVSEMLVGLLRTGKWILP
jgi:hypothetical protein